MPKEPHSDGQSDRFRSARVALLVPGLLAIATGLIAFVALGRRDPMHSLWDYQDERTAIIENEGNA